MKLIIGLGNPEEKYKNNRHNVGHIVVDELLSRVIPAGVIVKKTTNFMNESGEFVKKLVEQYHLNPSDLWVIHDDLDIPLGSYKIQFGKGPKIHKGLLSIDASLGTSDYWHVRIGIENRHSEVAESTSRGPVRGARRSLIGGKEYVLQDFTEEEKKILAKVIIEICKKLATS